MKPLNKIRRILAVQLMFLFLMGCQSVTQTDEVPTDGELGSSTPTVPVLMDTDMRKENISFTIVGLSSGCAADSGTGLYIPGIHALSYYDFEAQLSMVLCAQAGCSHSDNTCEAWLGENVRCFASYQGKWYVLDGGGGDGDLSLYEIDSITRNKRTLCTWNVGTQSWEDVNSAFLSSGYAYVTLTSSTISADGQTGTRHLDRVDLTSGDKEVLAENTDTVSFGFVSAGESQVVLSVSTLSAIPQTREEYAVSHPNASDEDYMQYHSQFLEQNVTQELRIYNWDMESYSVLESAAAGYRFSGDPNIRYGMLFVYAVNDTLHVYDVDAGSDVEFLTAEGIINFWIMDGKVFYITITDQGGCQIFYCPIGSKQPVQLGNDGNTHSMVFSLSLETHDHFIGLYNGKRVWISKENFYAEHYDHAIALN